jgi:hypothetical protein
MVAEHPNPLYTIFLQALCSVNSIDLILYELRNRLSRLSYRLVISGCAVMLYALYSHPGN